MKIYGTYKQRFIQDGDFTEDVSLNGYYDLSFFLEYPSYQLPTLKVKDGIKTNLDYILVAEYDENIIQKQTVDAYISNIPSEFHLQILGIEEMRQYIRNNSNYNEISDGVFEIFPETNMIGQIIPAQYLTIE